MTESQTPSKIYTRSNEKWLKIFLQEAFDQLDLFQEPVGLYMIYCGKAGIGPFRKCLSHYFRCLNLMPKSAAIDMDGRIDTHSMQ